MKNNKINHGLIREETDKATTNIEKLKDSDREIVYKNGNDE